MGAGKPKARRGGRETPRQVKAASPHSLSTNGERPHFSFEYADRTCQSGFAFPPDSAADELDLLGFLCEMSQLTWANIEAQRSGPRRRHHDQPVASICKAAQVRLGDVRFDEVVDEEIFRFRLTGVKRLWGFRHGRVFHAVWWDPDHQVYPTEPN